MRYSFPKYFAFTSFVFAGSLGGLMFSFMDETPWQQRILIILGVSFAFSIVLAPLFYWLHPKLHRRHRRKELKKKLFQTFIQKHQFKILDTGYIIGKIDDYIVFLHAEYNDFQHTTWIEIQVIFDSKHKDSYISNEFIQRMIRKYHEKNVTWHINSVLIKQQYNIRLPKYEVLYPLLKRCISELKAQDISPISYQDWQQMIPKTQEYLDTQKNL